METLMEMVNQGGYQPILSMQLNTGSSYNTEVKWPLLFVQVCAAQLEVALR